MSIQDMLNSQSWQNHMNMISGASQEDILNQQKTRLMQAEAEQKQGDAQRQAALQQVLASGKGQITPEMVQKVMEVDAETGIKLYDMLQKQSEPDLKINPVTGEVMDFKGGKPRIVPVEGMGGGAPMDGTVPAPLPPGVDDNPKNRMKYQEQLITDAPKLKEKLDGQNRLRTVLSSMRDDVAALDKSGALVSGDKSINQNITNYLLRGDTGQELGKAVGTNASADVEGFKSKRTLLLQAIMQATGMSAKQLDSNTELKMYLDSLGSAQNQAKTTHEILGNIEKMFLPPVNGGDGGNTPPNREAVAAELKRRGLLK